MDHYQIAEFVNSKDVRKYLQKNHYEFTTPQAAWIVCHSRNLTVANRHRAWKEVIQSWPDCSIEKRSQLMRIDSIHALLSAYMTLEESSIKRFTAEAGCVYSYEYHEQYAGDSLYDDDWYDGEAFFSDYCSCINQCKHHFERNYDIDKVRIWKHSLCPSIGTRPNRPNSMLVNRDLDVLSIELDYDNLADAELLLTFDRICFDFPTPFHRGDLLVDSKTEGIPNRTPFVLSYITTWDSREMLARGFSRGECPGTMTWEEFDNLAERVRNWGDCIDGHPIGTVISGGNLVTDSILIAPTDVEYYNGELTGVERQLKALSCYERGEIGIDLLVNGCYAIREQGYSEEVVRECIKPYSKDVLGWIGL